VLVAVGLGAFVVARLLFRGVTEQMVNFFVLLVPLIGLYLLVESYLQDESYVGNVFKTFKPPRFGR
jgi:hypothetical protein